MKWIQLLSYRSTPGHGYFSLPHHLNLNVPSQFRQNEYEEDIDWCIPLIFNFSLLSLYSEKKMVVKTLKNWHPEIYLFLKKKLKPGDSYLNDRALKHKSGKNMFFLTSAHGDWCFDVPKNFIYVSLGKSDGSFDFLVNKSFSITANCLVSKEEYQSLYNNNPVDQNFVDSHKYTRNEEFYTWEHYTQTTGKQRFK
jgi:hypothetical protein